MRKSILIPAIVALLTSVSSISSGADKVPSPKINHIGAEVSVGLPDGASIGAVLKPKWYWLSTGLSATYNGFSPGLKGSVKLDPIKYPLRLSLTGELGHSFETNLHSYSKDIPRFNYTYINIHPGIEIGSGNNFSFFIHAGPSWISVQTTDFSSTVKSDNYTVSDPKVTGWFVPTAKLGVVWMFL